MMEVTRSRYVVVTAAEWLDSVRRQVAHPEWIGANTGLTDLSSVTNIHSSRVGVLVGGG